MQDDGAVLLSAFAEASGFAKATPDKSVRQAAQMILAGENPRTVKSCGPDAPSLASSLAEARSAQPGWTKP
jgi:hypothetical protein